MSTNPQARAYYDIPKEAQKLRVKHYVDHHFLCDLDDMSRDLGLPKSTLTARLSPYLKSGEVGEREPEHGNTQYFTTECETEKQLAAHKYKARNHLITKTWKRLKKEGRGTQTIYAHLMAVYNELEGTNF